MPCNYQHKTGARLYKNYTEEIMMKALEDVPKLGLTGSSRLHKIPYGSLFNKVHGKHKHVRIIKISLFMG